MAGNASFKMPVSMSVQSTIKQVTRNLSAIERKVIPKATVTALNKVGKEVTTVAVKTINARTGLQQKVIREFLDSFKASSRSWVFLLRARRRPFNLIRFGARQTKKGVSANAWEGRKVYKGAFIGNSGRTVFTRKGKARTPIKSVYGPDMRVFLEKTNLDAMEKKVGERFPKLLFDAINFQLIKLRGIN
jgi:hypothetical protein